MDRSAIQPEGNLEKFSKGGHLQRLLAREAELRFDAHISIKAAVLVDSTVGHPVQISCSTLVPVCHWLLGKSKHADVNRSFRDCSKQTLVIDPRKRGSLIRCFHSDITNADVLEFKVLRMTRQMQAREKILNA